MIDKLFDIDISNNLCVSITKNEIYNQFLMYMFFRLDKDMVVVVPNLNEANKLYSDLSHYLKDKVYIFPDDDYLTKKAIASSPDLMYMRMRFLDSFDNKTKKILICHTNSFLKKLPSKKKFFSKVIDIKVGSNINRDEFINKLVKNGYKRDSIVTNTGEFSVRGFILDVFPIFSDHPIRIEFFDDVIDSIRMFDENSQLSKDEIDNIIIKPVTDEEDMSDGKVIDYLDNPLLVFEDYDLIKTMEKGINEQLKYYEEVNVFYKLDEVRSDINVFVNTIDNNDKDLFISASSVSSFNGNIKEFKGKLELDNSYLCSDDKKFINKIKVDSNKVIDIDLLSGFIYNDIIYYSKYDVYPVINRVSYNTGYKMGKKVNSIDKLEIGDYVVHKASGIGIYKGITTILKNNVKKDYILIEYKGDDKLYLPVDKVDKLYKYSSKDGARVNINKLNSVEWQKTKMRIRNKIRDISDELIKIYKNRSVSKVKPFEKDTPLQEVFESEFKFEETPDQLKCTLEIKKDLESDKPMDRLLCGDVGYGKTEVIFRAIMKSVINNKQVMYLCPTTLLSYQQYMSSLDRFKNYAVNIRLLNRYTSKKEANSILEDLKSGKIDVIFGTHRLLSSDVIFKDLGLLVIDEEQRFGVVHKEKIKKYKSNVHVLSVSATPIPRSLQMSLIGVRDLSLIETPPKSKLPVQTYVIGYDPYLLRNAIMKEKSRGGQVFILYNKVIDIDKVSHDFSKLVPEVSIRYAHGRMSKDEMQDIMYEFNLGNFDCLVSTTIIENGIDVSNANTIIIMDADRFGLSQLYQIRGRVGRSDRQAYAYLMYNKDKILGDIAKKRLEAIKEFTELGSGYKIAMRDLSIRGAGDLLGREQAGFIDSVGVDMYIDLINEELNGTKEEDSDEVVLDDVSTHINDMYSDEDSVIIEIHKLISSINNMEDYKNISNIIKDRFGIITDEVNIYMKNELTERLIDKLGIKINRNDSSKIEIKLDEDVYSKLNIENLFIEASRINTKFNFSYKGNNLYISIVKNNLDKHYINYLLDLILYINEKVNSN